MPKISVILPIYNASSCIEETLNYILAQTFNDYEVICVDDGSTDNTLAVLKDYEKKDKRLKVISQSNGGAGKARNTGLDNASGDYLAFLDADDLYDPDMLSKAYSKAVEGNADLVVWKCDRYNDTTKEYSPTPWTLREKDLPPYRPMYYRNFTDNVFKVFVGWAWGERAFAAQLSNHGQLGNQGLARVVSLLLRWVTPVLILLVMLAGLGVFSGA